MVIHAVRDVDHAATGKFTRGPETFVVMKVEDVEKGKTRATRTDRWTDEIHNVDIEKANEIELTVYDKSGARPTPIGMLWIRISDIAEEMRRKKIESELGNSQWVTADRMDNTSMQHRQDSAYGSATQSLQDRTSRGSGQQYPPPAMPGQDPSTPTAIDAWFALEPVGSIHLSMSFSRFVRQAIIDRSLKICSKAEPGQKTIRYWAKPQRCRAATQGRDPRAVWSQIRDTAILQHHALRSLWRLSQILGRHAVRRLQIYLP